MLRYIENYDNLIEGHKYLIINSRIGEKFTGVFDKKKDEFTDVNILECDNKESLINLYGDDGFLAYLPDDDIYEYDKNTDLVIEVL